MFNIWYLPKDNFPTLIRFLNTKLYYYAVPITLARSGWHQQQRQRAFVVMAHW
jgi:hypothetical protein